MGFFHLRCYKNKTRGCVLVKAQLWNETLCLSVLWALTETKGNPTSLSGLAEGQKLLMKSRSTKQVLLTDSSGCSVCCGTPLPEQMALLTVVEFWDRVLISPNCCFVHNLFFSATDFPPQHFQEFWKRPGSCLLLQSAGDNFHSPFHLFQHLDGCIPMSGFKTAAVGLSWVADFLIFLKPMHCTDFSGVFLKRKVQKLNSLHSCTTSVWAVERQISPLTGVWPEALREEVSCGSSLCGSHVKVNSKLKHASWGVCYWRQFCVFISLWFCFMGCWT